MASSLDAATVGEILTTIRASRPNAAQYLLKRFKVIEEQTASLRTARLPQAPSKVLESLAPIEGACRRLLEFLALQNDDTPFAEMPPALTAFHNVRFQLAAAFSPEHPETLFKDGTIDTVIGGHADSLTRLLAGLERSRQSFEKRTTLDLANNPVAGLVKEVEVVPAKAAFRKRERDDIRHRPDMELDGAVVLLVELYQKLTASRPTQTINGPTVRFLRLLLPRLGWEDKSDNALRHLVRKALTIEPKPGRRAEGQN